MNHHAGCIGLFGRPDSIMSEPRSAMAEKGISRGDVSIR
jgi:hypothetical protein